MQNKNVNDINKLLEKILDAKYPSDAERLINEYDPVFSASEQPDMRKLWNNIRDLSQKFMKIYYESKNAVPSSMPDVNSAEMTEAGHILENNLFDYHFQPIVSAKNGEIYSYEALMRPRSKLRISPLDILKYAEITGSLSMVEYCTFSNILGIIDKDKSQFRGRRVFINSIPGAYLDYSRETEVGLLLRRHADTAVVEITEHSDLDEDAIDALKTSLDNVGIKMAIDDFGTGYSNISNLLNYMPNYVKIDRSLLSGIQNSPRKRHFVREIVDFCRDNDILALAEGVETTEELREVILLGVDLIQGYYTARPQAEIMESIPYEIRQEIIHYHQERQDGQMKQMYTAETSERIQLDRLAKNGFRCISINASGGKYIVEGDPSTIYDIHIEIAEGFKGRLVLENAGLSNIHGRPSIDVGKNGELTVILKGENRLKNGGIHIPPESKLIMNGIGNLTIMLDTQEYYGIGADIKSSHGDLVFDQDGCIMINVGGGTGVGIGGGMGGNVHILRGKYILNMNSSVGVGIGSMYMDTFINMDKCDFSADVSLTNGTVLGSVSGGTNVRILNSSIKVYAGGNEVAGIGTLEGPCSFVSFEESSMMLNMSAECCTGVGALHGHTDLMIRSAGIRINCEGARVMPFGGFSRDTVAHIINADTSLNLKTSIDFMDNIDKERLNIEHGRMFVMVNGYEYDVFDNRTVMKLESEE